MKNIDEAFCYLWFDSKNRKFYLGYHGGHPDDDYTHSSTVMESFTKKTIPSYMHRRILATGTEQEMMDLENKLLENRKRCPRRWDKYYNVTTCFPPPPKYGEDHPQWKGGVTFDMVEYERKYREENREKKRESNRKYYEKNAEKVRESNLKYYEENREHCRDYQRKYYQENAEQIREQKRKYYQENAEQIREHKRKYYEKKKAEKLKNMSTLEEFFG